MLTQLETLLAYCQQPLTLSMHKYITSQQITMLLSQTHIHPFLQIYMLQGSHILHACMFRMAQSNQRGSSTTGERRGGGVSSGRKTSVMRLKQNAKTNREERQRDRERRRGRGSVIPTVHGSASYFVLALFQFAAPSVSSTSHNRLRRQKYYFYCVTLS